MPSFKIENDLNARGYSYIAGVDEAGRGCLFGPVMAAAVVFPVSHLRSNAPSWIDDLDDSKKLSPSKREYLAPQIQRYALSVGVGMATSREIDALNIRQASFLAMRRAVLNLAVDADFLLVDGFRLDEFSCPQMGIPKGDGRCYSIAAASIVAKVLRDRMMCQFDTLFQGYGIAAHKGYGTKRHVESLRRLGPSSLHRQSFKISRSGDMVQ